MRVGVLTGVGDCTGLNAVIHAVTKSLIGQGGCEVVGIQDGFEDLMGDAPRVKPLGWEQVSGIVHTGGTIVLGHVQRGGDPTPFDRVLATQFGHHAAQLVLASRFGRMVTLQGGAITSVPIATVANTQWQIPADHPLLTMARDIGICLGEA